jgi:hypothetical protein
MVKPLVSLVRLSLLLLPLSSSSAKSKLIGAVGLEVSMVTVVVGAVQTLPDGATWVNATGINKAWAAADDAVTLIAGTGKTLTARVIDTAGNVTALTLSDNGYPLDTGNPLVTLNTTTDTKNTGNVSLQSSETGTAYGV